MRLIILPLLVLLSGCLDVLGPDDGSWEFSEGNDPISGEPFAQAILDRFYPLSLVVRCRSGTLDVYVKTDFITDSGQVRYRIDDGQYRAETWSEATDYQALFYRGDDRAFARQLTGASSMIFEAREHVGDLHRRTFQLHGLGAHLPKIEAACP
jgi:hypothetical protein